MFRIKARIAPALLRDHLEQVKTGLPGRAYVRLDPGVDWPAELRTRLPE
jgi:HlyD family secretion protein